MKRVLFWTPVFFTLVGALIYFNSFQASFRFDDRNFIADKMHVHDLGQVWKEGETLRKIPYLTFALNYAWTGEKVWSWHLVNFLLHLAVSLLVWALSRVSWRLPALEDSPLKKHAEGLSVLSGLLFLCHPVQTSAVTYIYQRTIVIAALFHVLTLYLYAKACLERKFTLFALAAVSAVLACFTKQVNLSLPFTLLLYEAAFSSGSVKNFFKRWPRFLAYSAAPLAAYLWVFKGGLIRTALQGGLRELYPSNINSSLTWGQWMATQFNVMRTYFRLMVFPMNQALDYDYPIAGSFTEPSVLISLGLLLVILAAAVWRWRGHRLAAFGVFFIVITLAPEFFAIRDTFFEHRMYLPMVGFALLAPSALQALLGNFRKTKIVCALLLAALCAATWARNAVWADEEKFWIEDIKHAPLRGRPYYSLGVYYALRGEHAKAVPLYVRAIELWPNFADAYANLGKSLEHTGHMKDAIFYYAKAVELDPTLSQAQNNLGSALVREGRYEEARRAYRAAIKSKSDSYETLNNMGSSYAQEKKYDEAYEWYLKALKTNPQYAHAHNNLGTILGMRGDLAGAEEYYKSAIRLNPDFFEARNNLAELYVRRRAYPAAIREYREALRIRPDYAESNNNLASLLARSGEYGEAERYYLEAIRYKPDFVDAFVNLANVYLKLGRLSDARKWADEALRLKPGHPAALEIQNTTNGDKNKIVNNS